MSLVAWFPQILAVHVGTVAISGSLFALRGAARMAGWPVANHRALRYFSYLNDTVLLIAAILLTLIVRQYPLLDAWLTVKVALLLVYIALGSIALRRGRTPRARALAYAVALATFGFIVSVALTQNPWGVLALLAR
ncbi:MAG: SirB2 family protein [Xanthomonadaceae bacterium]|nr:SirB2 family protein [Xanthomonadaceae bacterium]MDE1957621.1 SirB2 family protein [Xanthomonadaceae bacterium]MDE2177643.1 SirB2 family protein [Xanthomonadaceae bacterium]MDE2246570.1 SirB2 family protein [Xanthomonadaceae bacterium]